jgi:tetratricopeptide (TPR) repeat protein
MSRIQQIQRLLDNDRDDVFLNFSLAMELASTGQSAEALERFDRVLQLDPNYLAAYDRKGDLLVNLKRPDEARETFRAGIEAAGRVGDDHMRDKMTTSLKLLG